MSIWSVTAGDCRKILREMPPNSVDSAVTDPPYGLAVPPDPEKLLSHWLRGREFVPRGKGFMGQAWDASVPSPMMFRELFRVLRPGAHAVVFAGSRTVDLMGLSMRLAGFEIRDQLQWIYGSGFPKSLDVSKAIDKSAGVWRGRAGPMNSDNSAMGGGNYERTPKGSPATADALRWQGFGTALKPAHEPIILARKPLVGTVAANYIEHGTGGINVDGCRIPSIEPTGWGGGGSSLFDGGLSRESKIAHRENLGRFPANILMDESAGALLDAQSGDRPGMSGGGIHTSSGGMFGAIDGNEGHLRGDSGGASRFFFCAKACRAEREAGLEHLEPIRRSDGRGKDIENPRLRTTARRNHHPTVKPIALMRWLCRLVTPPGGLIVDPFTGSGTTGIAASVEGFSFAGCELSEEFARIARERIAYFVGRPDMADAAEVASRNAERRQMELFS